MFEALMLLAANGPAIAASIVGIAETLKGDGKLTPEQVAAIKARAENSNTAWDELVERLKSKQPSP